MTKTQQFDQHAANMRTLTEDFNDLERLHRNADKILTDTLTLLAQSTDHEQTVATIVAGWTDIPKWYA